MEHLSLLWILLFLNSIFSDISIAAPTFSILYCLSSFILYTLILCGVFVLSVALINSIYLDKKKTIMAIISLLDEANLFIIIMLIDIF